MQQEGEFFPVKKWNVDEEKLMRQFVEPYRAGHPITSDGEVVRMDELKSMRIGRSPVQLAPPNAGHDWEFFRRLEQVTDDYLEGPPGYAASESTHAPTTAGQTAIDQVLTLCERFPRFARELRSRRSGRPPLEMDDEYDVQYVLRALLALTFDDVRDETWTPEYAGGSAREDFLLPQEKIVVEAKRTRDSQKTRELGDELIVDIERYGADDRCETLVCFIYDPEHRVDNPRGFASDLARGRPGLEVFVVIAPLA